jgi:hypothetical protein
VHAVAIDAVKLGHGSEERNLRVSLTLTV